MRDHRATLRAARDLGQGLLIVALTGCTITVPVVEGTTTTVGPSGGVLTSADGFLELRVPPGALAADTAIRILTDRARVVPGVEGPIYTLEPASLELAKPIIAAYRAGERLGVVWSGRRALGTVDGDRFEELPGSPVTPVYDRRTHVARGELASLARREIGLGVVQDPPSCVGRPCGTPCGPCMGDAPGCMPDPLGPVCHPVGACVSPPDPSCVTQGWLDPPGSGHVYVVSQMGLTGDGAGAVLGAFANSQLAHNVLGGELTLLFEVVGGDYEPIFGEDPQLALRVYRGVDADDPFFPSNNFQPLPGESGCCEFKVLAESLTSTPSQPRVQLPAWMSGGFIENVGSRDGPELSYPLLLGDAPMILEGAHFSLSDPVGDGTLTGVFGGGVTITSLNQTANPSCVGGVSASCPSGELRSSWLDLLASLGPPDIDLDADGLERVEIGANLRVAHCYDGDGREVPPPFPEDPSSCATTAQMADAYALDYAITLVPAKIVGVR